MILFTWNSGTDELIYCNRNQNNGYLGWWGGDVGYECVLELPEKGHEKSFWGDGRFLYIEYGMLT